MFTWFNKWNEKRKLNNLRERFIQDLEYYDGMRIRAVLYNEKNGGYCPLGRAAIVAEIPIKSHKIYDNLRAAYGFCEGAMERIWQWNDAEDLSFFGTAQKIRSHYNEIFCDGESNAA